MNDIERAEKVKPLTKTGKFFVFLQTITPILILLGIFTTAYLPLFNIFVGIEVIILIIVATLTIGLIIFNDKYRSLWKNLGNASASIPIIMKIGYYVYGAAILTALLTLLYFSISKNITKKKKHVIFSVIMMILAIGLIIAHHLIFINLPQGN